MYVAKKATTGTHHAGPFFTIAVLSIWCCIALPAVADTWDAEQYELLAGDFNGDAKDDLLVRPIDSSQTVSIVLSEPSGTPTSINQRWAADYLGLDWAVGDSDVFIGNFDGDPGGQADIFLLGRANQSHRVLVSDGNARFESITQTIGNDELLTDLSRDTHTIVVGDFNADGSDDLFLQARTRGGINAVALGGGTGAMFTVVQSWVDDPLQSDLGWTLFESTVVAGNFDAIPGDELLVIAKPRPVIIASVVDFPVMRLGPDSFGLVRMNGGPVQILQTWDSDDFGVDWSAGSHEIVVLDANGDQIDDIFLQAKDSSDPSYVIQADGTSTGFSTQSSVQTLNNGDFGVDWSAQAFTAIGGSFGGGSLSGLYLQSTAASGSNKIVTFAGNGFVSSAAVHATDAVTVLGDDVLGNPAVGAVKGDLNVAGGAASYRVPIMVPPGRAGVAPGVALTYNSRSGNGRLGVGWSLSAGSTIFRCGPTIVHDGFVDGVSFSANDRYCMDGQRLLLSSGSAYGADNSQYRTEIDNFSRITLNYDGNGQPTTFTVEAKNGMILTYGGNQVVVAQGRSDNFVWPLIKKTDRHSNEIQYSYDLSGMSTDGEYMLEEISYTHPTPASALRYVRFEYNDTLLDPRPDITVSYFAGSKRRTTRRLASVETFVGTRPVRRYSLGYELSAVTQRSLLNSITECAYDINGANEQCLPPSTFDWQGTAGFSTQNNFPGIQTGPAGSFHDGGALSLFDHGYVDLDGNGRADFIYFGAAGLYRWDGQEGGFGTLEGPLSINATVEDGVRLSNNPMIDWNHDGKSDFTAPFGTVTPNPPGTSSWVSLPRFDEDGDFSGDWTNASNATCYVIQRRPAISGSWTDYATSTASQYNFVGHQTGAWQFRVQAFNSGGVGGGYSGVKEIEIGLARSSRLPPSAAERMSACSPPPVEDEGTIGIVWFDANNNVQTHDTGIKVSTPSDFPAPHDNREPPAGHYMVLDVNGDGKQDIVTRYQDKWRIHLRTQTGFQEQASTVDVGDDIAVRVIEYNGDGKSDLLALQPNGAQPRLLLSQGTSFQVIANVLPQVGYGSYEYFDEGIQEEATNLEQPVPPIQGDFNGDGLTDFVIAQDAESDPNGRMYLHLNTGSGFEVIDTGHDSPFSAPTPRGSHFALSPERLAYFIQVIDYDGDGDLDLLLPAVKQTDAYGPCVPVSPTEMECEGVDFVAIEDEYTWDVMQFNGENFSAPLSTGIRMPLSGGRNLDLNADGLDDLLTPASGAHDQLQPEPHADVRLRRGPHPDMISDIRDGLGRQAQITYASTGSSAVYDLASAAQVNNFPEMNFASTMQVVQSLAQSNGIDNDTNLTSYYYRNARYHLQGRGFLGFEYVEVTDQAQGLVTESEIDLTFPLIGRPKKITIFELGAQPDTQFISRTLTTWDANPTAGGAQFVYADIVEQTTQEPNNNYVQTGTVLTDIDIGTNGCVTRVEKVQEDSFVEHTTITTSTYSNVTASWWLCRLNNQTVEATVVQKVAPFPTGPDWVSTSGGVSHTETRNVNFLYYGDSVAAGKRKVKKQRNELGDAQLASYREIKYDTYGNVIEQIDNNTTDVTDPALAVTKRISKTTYEPNGYFPQSAINAEGHVSSQAFDPAHGVVLSGTDPNGISGTNGHDNFGRAVSTRVVDLPPTAVTYEHCGLECPAQARYAITSSQAGSPTSTEYYDQFSRVVRSAVQGFDGRLRLTDTQFDSLGRTERQSEPYYAGETRYDTVFAGFDVLNRPGTKIAPNAMVTAYVYEGLKTRIDVTADSRTIEVSRTSNSLGQLVHTEQVDDSLPSPEDVLSTHFRHDAFGNPVLIQDPEGNQITAEYDRLSRKTEFADPNRGTWSFVHDVLGQIVRQVDANGGIMEYDYDKLGRALKRYEQRPGASTLEAVAEWVYDGPAGSEQAPFIGKLHTAKTLNSQSGYTQSYLYDAIYGRPTQTSTSLHMGVGTMSFDSTTGYDALGRPSSLTYPTGMSIGYRYNAYGYLDQESELGTGNVLRAITAQDARNQVTSQSFGWDGKLNQSKAFNAATGLVEGLCVGTGSTCTAQTADVQGLSYGYDGYMNMAWRENHSQTVKEYFDDYDALHRLTQTHLELTDGSGTTFPAVTYQYDRLGNMKAKSDFATIYDYDGAGVSWTNFAGPNAVTEVALVGGGSVKYSYDANGNLIESDGPSHDRLLTYTMGNLPEAIDTPDSDVTFRYSPDGVRWKQTQLDNGASKVSYYVDSLFEYVVSDSPGADQVVEQRHYIGGYLVYTESDSATLPVYDKTEWSFLLDDHLGSVDTIAKSDGTVVERHSYDVFGKPRKATWTEDAGAAGFPYSAEQLYPFTDARSAVTPRGFTQHEHLDSVGLIHMNGRSYDPALGRFLGVDPFIQYPENSQSLNPYSYVLNNPLSATDPTGYLRRPIGMNAFQFRDYTDSFTSAAGAEETPADGKKKGNVAVNVGAAEGPSPTKINDSNPIAYLEMFSDDDVSHLASLTGIPGKDMNPFTHPFAGPFSDDDGPPATDEQLIQRVGEVLEMLREIDEFAEMEAKGIQMQGEIRHEVGRGIGGSTHLRGTISIDLDDIGKELPVDLMDLDEERFVTAPRGTQIWKEQQQAFWDMTTPQTIRRILVHETLHAVHSDGFAHNERFIRAETNDFLKEHFGDLKRK